MLSRTIAQDSKTSAPASFATIIRHIPKCVLSTDNKICGTPNIPDHPKRKSIVQIGFDCVRKGSKGSQEIEQAHNAVTASRVRLGTKVLILVTMATIQYQDDFTSFKSLWKLGI
jgi:hypothetical protein